MILLFSDDGDWGLTARDLFIGRFHSVPLALDSIKKPKVGNSFSLFNVEADVWLRFRRIRGQEWSEIEAD